jgi:hypothetical protein
MTYDDWDVQSDEDAAERTAFYRAANRRRFLQAQEDRDTGNELDPLLFEEPEEEAFEECFNSIVAQMGEVISEWDTADAQEEEEV